MFYIENIFLDIFILSSIVQNKKANRNLNQCEFCYGVFNHLPFCIQLDLKKTIYIKLYLLRALVLHRTDISLTGANLMFGQ